MLFSKQCSRNKDSYLFAVKYGPERGLDRNLSFTVTDIAAKQHVHGSFRMHVFLDLLKSLYLIGRLVIREKIIKFPVQGGIFTEYESTGNLSLGIQLDEFVGHFPDFFFDPLFCFVPFFASKLGNACGIPFSGTVFLYFIYAVKRDTKPVAMCIFQGDQVFFAAFSLLPLQSRESFYSVVPMHDQVTDFHIFYSEEKPG